MVAVGTAVGTALGCAWGAEVGGGVGSDPQAAASSALDIKAITIMTNLFERNIYNSSESVGVSGLHWVVVSMPDVYMRHVVPAYVKYASHELNTGDYSNARECTVVLSAQLG